MKRILGLTISALVFLVAVSCSSNFKFGRNHEIKVSARMEGQRTTKANINGNIERSSKAVEFEGRILDIALESGCDVRSLYADSPETKGGVVTSENISRFNVDVYDSDDNLYTSLVAEKSGSKWTVSAENGFPTFWPEKEDDRELRFFAYSDKGSGLSYTVDGANLNIIYEGSAHQGSDDASLQNDLIFAYSCPEKYSVVDFTFSHALAGIQFKVGTVADGISIKSVTMDNVIKDGNCVFDSALSDKFSWTPSSSESSKTSFTQSFDIAAGSARGTGFDKAKTFFFIPQEVTEATTVTVVFSEGTYNYSITAPINDLCQKWCAGKIYTYTISGGVIKPSVDVRDNVTDKVKTDLVITNTSSGSAYIRANIVANWYNAAGEVVSGWNGEGTFENFPGEGWEKNSSDGIYYYKSAVASGESPAAPLFTKFTQPDAPVEGATLEMAIIVQSVCSLPDKDYRTIWQ